MCLTSKLMYNKATYKDAGICNPNAHSDVDHCLSNTSYMRVTLEQSKAHNPP